MRYLLTSLLCVFTLSLTAQEAGCTYQQADNFSPTAIVDDGTCVFFGGNQDDCPNTFDGDGDGNVAITDLLGLLAVFGDTDQDADGVWDSLDDCIDLTACNYFADPSEICQYLDIIGVCGGDCWVDDDSDLICDDVDECVGYYDECDVCNGSGIPEGYCDCFGSVLDECGTCDDDPSNDCVQDCNGEWGGTAVLDECDTCDSDPTNDCVQDCNLEWGGTAVVDECGTCDSDPSNDCVQDCNGDWGGVAALDECGVCDEDVTNDCVQDCNEEWGGTALLDECGVCDSDPTNDCVPDCNGVCCGTSVLDECGVCDGPGPTEIVIESITILYDSLYAEQIDEWWVYEVGADTVFNYTCAHSCGDDISHEGYDYSTVLIGDQCWFSENCRYLPEVSPGSEESLTAPYYYVFGYEGSDVAAAQVTDNYATYGVLYNWPAVMTEGICPSGWHIPSDGEWQTMEISLGMSESEAESEGWRGSPVGEYLKSTSGWDDGGNGSNSSGFNGLPGGVRYSGGFYPNGYLGHYGNWWSASESGSSSWVRRVGNFYGGNVNRFNGSRDYGFSARCVRCEADEDGDGVCDVNDECVDNTACNFEAVPSEPCEYTSCSGCTDSSSCNYDSTATIDDGSCEGDSDGDGICDSQDNCDGVEDECGVCNGPGPTGLVIDTITLLYDSIYSEAISEWWVFETGADTTYTYVCLTLITDANIHEAVDLWLSDEPTAEATYGQISDWDVSNVTDMNGLFFGANSFNGDITSWDVSSVTNMGSMFREAYIFNGDISSWDVSSVTNMSDLFRNAENFNGDISSWDVSSVTDMNGVFYDASIFNGDLSSWDVSSVTNMRGMFVRANNFNNDLSSWDVSGVTNMRSMFDGSNYNGDISSWDVSNVTNMLMMFYSNTSFNGDISSWDVSSVTNMRYMFSWSYSFNSDISSWDVSSVTDMHGMFWYASIFNGDLSSWDVSSVTNMYYMFAVVPSFNGDLSSWDVSSVTDMSQMFDNASIFNGDLSSWDVSSVTDMSQMFDNASSFNGDISSWDVSNVTNMDSMFNGTDSLSEENKCSIHNSFSSNGNWPYDWSEFCPPAVFTSCGDDIGHEGYDYSTVQIGEQCWFSENCRYLPSVSPSSEGSADPIYYVYGYEGTDVASAMSTDNYETYGVLYNWAAVMTEGFCPSGWHIPSDEEFTELTDFLGGASVAGYAMKDDVDWNGSNTSGWTGLPGGERYPSDFCCVGSSGSWWSASESASNSWIRLVSGGYGVNVYLTNNTQGSGYSARCVRD